MVEEEETKEKKRVKIFQRKRHLGTEGDFKIFILLLIAGIIFIIYAGVLIVYTVDSIAEASATRFYIPNTMTIDNMEPGATITIGILGLIPFVFFVVYLTNNFT